MYSGHSYRIIEVLDPEKALVPRCEGSERIIQGNQFGGKPRDAYCILTPGPCSLNSSASQPDHLPLVGASAAQVQFSRQDADTPGQRKIKTIRAGNDY